MIYNHKPCGKPPVCYWTWPWMMDLPLKKWWFAILMLVYQRVCMVIYSMDIWETYMDLTIKNMGSFHGNIMRMIPSGKLTNFWSFWGQLFRWSIPNLSVDYDLLNSENMGCAMVYPIINFRMEHIWTCDVKSQHHIFNGNFRRSLAISGT